MADLVKKIRTNSGDLQIDYNALANLPTISNPNLLINGDFQIWQRGERFSDHSNNYCADRWNIRNSNASTHLIEKSYDVPLDICVKNSIHIVEQRNTNTYLQYHFENSLRGIYTLSFWYKSTVAFKTFIIDDSQWIFLDDNAVTGEWSRVSYTFTASSLQRINLIHELNAGECYITGVKLEAGTVATQFSPRTYAEELALCRRYYQILEFDHNDVVCYLHHRNFNDYGGFLRFDQMSKIPTVDTIGTFYIEQYNSNGVIYGSYYYGDFTIDVVPQWTGLKFGVQFTTSDPVNYLAVSSESLSLILDAEIY